MNVILRARRQAGVGIVTAIFLLVVLAGLGVAMVGIYTSQQSSANLDLLGAQGYQAARAGLEWGIFQGLRNKTQPCTSKSTIAMPAWTSLSAFTVYVSCTAQGSGDQTRYLIQSEACNMPDTVGKTCPVTNNPESIRRTLEAEL
jgi:MSHA biogenesis protein MshP